MPASAPDRQPSPPPAAAASGLLALTPARVHEAEGPGRRAFALFQAQRHAGALLWIWPAHLPEAPMLPGLPQRVGPRLLLARPQDETELLWTAEEALRSGAPGLVVAEPQRPLTLTAGRRLQLAAEAGGTTGLMLIRQGCGSPAAESRWHCAPLPPVAASASASISAATDGPDSTRHLWRIIKNRKGTVDALSLDWDGTAAAFHLVSAAGQRCQPAAPAAGA